jgi:hypothetical protein
MSLAAHPISQPSFDLSSFWTPVIEAEVIEPQLQLV